MASLRFSQRSTNEETMTTKHQPVLRDGVYWINIQIDGRRLRKSLGTKDAKLAQEAFTRELAEFYRTRKFKELPKKTVNDAFDQWLKERSTKRSIEDDQRKIDYFRAKLGAMQLCELRTADIEKHLPESVTPSTRNRYRALMRAVLRRAMRTWEWLDSVPTIEEEDEPEGYTGFLTREQAERLIAELPERYRKPVRFALLTGLRRANVFGLTWDKVDLGAGTVIVEAATAKGKRRFIVPLNASARALLESVEGREGRVWGDVTQVWQNVWEAACKRAGVKIKFHGLRHTWATWHAQAGTPLDVLQKLGAWATHSMVLRYAQRPADYLAQAAERIAM